MALEKNDVKTLRLEIINVMLHRTTPYWDHYMQVLYTMSQYMVREIMRTTVYH